MVNLHGDAHLEQYAVTDEAYGLNDFDQAGFGPAVVDLVRFGASIHLACTHTAWSGCDPEAAIEVFLTQYLKAVMKPDLAGPIPTLVRRLRSQPVPSRRAFLDWAEGLMLDLPDASVRHVQNAWRDLSEMLYATEPERSIGFYVPRRLGGLDLGIGSALLNKLLVRVEGPSPSDLDDRIVEVKQQDPSPKTACVYHPPTGGVLYPQVMQLRLGRLRPEILAYLPHPGLTAEAEQHRGGWMYWVHSWDPGYRELKVTEIAAQSELMEIAADVGRQLGQGHCRYVTAPLEAQHRFAHHTSIEEVRDQVFVTSRLLAAQVVEDWRKERVRLQP